MVEHEQLDSQALELLPPTVVTVEVEQPPGVPAAITAPTPATNGLRAPGTATRSWWSETDTLAIASVLCGFTAVVPVLSQVAGLLLGIASLIRIRRARRCGVRLRGKPWALAGIVSSGFVLLSWIAVLAMLIAARISLLHTAGALRALFPPGH